MGSIPWLGRSPGEGSGNAVQCSCLGNPMDRGAWRATIHRVPKSQTPLSTHITLCKLLYNNMPLNLVPCFGLRAPVLQTLYFWYVHNKLKLIQLLQWFTGFTSAFFLNFWQFTASEVESREDPQWLRGRWATGAGTQGAPCVCSFLTDPAVSGVGLSDLSSSLCILSSPTWLCTIAFCFCMCKLL